MPPRLLPRQKRVKTRPIDSSGMPGPSSLTVTAVPVSSPLAGPDAGATSMVTVPSPWRTAFSRRLPSTWSILSGSAHSAGSGCPMRTRNRSAAWPFAVSGLDVAADGGGDVDGLAAQLQAAGVDPGDVEQLGDEPGDAVGVGVDGLQHQPLLVVGEPLPLGEQGRREALDGGERGAQLMGDGGDQLGVAALGAAAGLGAAQGDDEAAHGSGRALAYVPGGDQDLTAAGQQQIPLGLADPGGEPAVRVGQLPPAAALEVLQRQRAFQRAAEGVGRRGWR